MNIRDRVKEFRRVPAGQLRPNPRNWRRHPVPQQEALRGILTEVGFAGAILVRELAGGALEIIDGHLRAETVADALVPVLVLDVNEEEANKLLATFDTLCTAAEIDDEVRNALIVDLDIASSPLRQMLDRLRRPLQIPERTPERVAKEKEIGELFQVIVECAGEVEQQEVYERLVNEGFKCKLRCL